MTGVPRWGRIDTKAKPAGAIRVLSLNPNGLPQWSRENHKADRLKFMVQEYDPDTVGLQELCQNPYASKASLTVADMLRTRKGTSGLSCPTIRGRTVKTWGATSREVQPL